MFNKKRFSFGSLRLRLLILILFAVLPSIIQVYLHASQDHKQALDKAEKDMLQIANLATSNQQYFVEQTRQFLISLRKSEKIEALLNTPTCQQIYKDLEINYQQQLPRYLNLAIINPQGKIECPVKPINSSLDWSNNPAFQQANQSLDFVIGDYAVDNVLNKSYISFIMPVLNYQGTEPIFFLLAMLDLNWLQQFITEINLPPEAIFRLLNSEGIVLIQYPDTQGGLGKPLPQPEILQSIKANVATGLEEGTIEVVDNNGIPYLYAYSSLPGASNTPPYISIAIPSDTVFGNATKEFSRNLIILGAILGLALVVAWWGSDIIILRQINRLLQTTQELRAGNLSARTNLKYSEGEIGQLTHAFDNMAAALEQREKQLKEAEREATEARFASMLNIAQEAIIAADEQQNIILFNKGAEYIFNYKAVNIIGHPLKTLIAKKSYPLYQKYFDRFQSAQTMTGKRIELIAQRKKGDSFPVEMSISKISQAEQSIFNVIFSDITERKQAEEILFQKNRFLATLHQIALNLLNRLTLPDLLQEILTQAGYMANTLHGYIYLIEPFIRTNSNNPTKINQYKLVSKAGTGIFAHHIGINLKPGEGVSGKVWQTGELLVVNNYATWEGGSPQFDSVPIRTTVGVPIKFGSQVVGVIGLGRIGHITQPFTEIQIEQLTALAQLASVALDNAQLFAEAQQELTDRKQAEKELKIANQHLRTLNNRLQQELNLAQKIQQSLLPPSQPNWEALDIICYSIPAREVGGDFYQHYAFKEGGFAVAVGDVSDKGMPAALLMAVSLTSFHSVVSKQLPPNQLLMHLDQELVPYTRTTNQNCALIYVEITPTPNNNKKTLRIANAGCVIPLIKPLNGQAEWIMVGGIPLGIGLGVENGYEEVSLTLNTGDLIILSSDGVIEAKNKANQLFGFERLYQTVTNGPQTNAKAMLTHIKNTVKTFINGNDLADDLTIVVLKL